MRSVARPTRICARSREVSGVGPLWIQPWWCFSVAAAAAGVLSTLSSFKYPRNVCPGHGPGRRRGGSRVGGRGGEKESHYLSQVPRYSLGTRSVLPNVSNSCGRKYFVLECCIERASSWRQRQTLLNSWLE